MNFSSFLFVPDRQMTPLHTDVKWNPNLKEPSVDIITAPYLHCMSAKFPESCLLRLVTVFVSDSVYLYLWPWVSLFKINIDTDNI